ncbi:PREDICTED: pentatricopeptide repeat-containing protein At2g15980 [Nicotiana attenuata]|uniref:Pentatricopeptide repeat-containing protein n=1 Tax=Nicotiana attenuata TaxID=49451 RepID=A0A1J6J6F4_NICAT|nr:PREDICTED: pentatricopeptide repeat-containing protein At2g15980 [Nicotiana attenuata]OIT02809.1 pentatricopeptide repeat-containing protein [Nicotiana attenuata]
MAMLSTITRRTIFSTPLTEHLSSSSFSSSTSPQPSSNEDETLVSTAIKILKHHRSKSRWSEILSLSPPPSGFTPTQVSQIILQLRNTPHLALRFFHFTITRSICSHSLYSYATIIHILSRSRLKSQALELLKSAIRKFPDTHQPDLTNPPRIFQILVKTYRTCDSAPFVFDLLIKAYLDSKKIDLSVKLVRILAKKNIFPHVVICNSLIELIAKSRGPFAAYDMYREIFKGREVKGVIVNAYTFNILMVAFHRDGVVEKVEEVWKEMMEKNCASNTYSYSVLMAAYCEDGLMENAMNVWEEMGDKGVKHDIVAYNTIIGGFCKVGEVDRAEDFFREMVFAGVECTYVTLEHLINGHCMSGNVDAALVLYKDMCRKGFKPESSMIDAVARMLCDKNGVFEGLEFVRAVIKKHDTVPRKSTYELLIRSLCEEGLMEDAQKLQVEMVGKGFAPNVDVYSAFIDGYIKQGNDKMAETLRNEMLTNKIPCKDS